MALTPAETDTALTAVPGNPHELAGFRRKGYYIARGLCPPDLVSAMRSAAEDDLARRSGLLELEAEVGYPGAPAGAHMPGADTVRRLKLALDRAPVFSQWALSDRLLTRVRRLLGTAQLRLIQAHHNCIMTKHPRFSSSTGWHQDTRYWSYERGELVNAWTALRREGPDNGGMRLMPGSHRMQFDPARFDAQSFFREDLAENAKLIDTAVQADMVAGDVLFFHAGLLHSAGDNRTGDCKFSVVFSYRPVDNLPLAGSRSASLADIDPESQGR